MSLSATEQSFVREFEERQAAVFAAVQQRVRKKPILETLANPSGLARAALILPMPWVSLYIVLQLSFATAQELQPMGFVVAFLVGYFVVDLATGILHMRFDTIPLPMSADRTWMQFIAWGFQRHHAVQHNWLHDDILESGILTSGFLTVPFYLLYLAFYQGGLLTCPYTAFAWTVFIIAGVHVQVFHAAAHNTWKSTNPQLQALFRILMDLGLILDTKDHHQHHTQFDCNFSMINGWSNCVLNPLYRYLERNGYIHPDMQGHVQRRVYIQEKALLTEPYSRMFPEYRAFQSRMMKQDVVQASLRKN